MFLRFLKSVVVCWLAVGGFSGAQARELRVCADPDNLPFSNVRQQGFENHIARIVARDLGVELKYEWQRMGRGFVREYVDKSRCDVLIGIPVGYRAVLATAPYYRSSYVFVTRRGARFQPSSLDDPRLRALKIGVQAVDEEYAPPAGALARRGMQSSLVGFYSVGRHASDIVRAVLDGRIDVAIVWGPIAGYAARKFPKQLELRSVTPQMDPPALPLTFEIAMGVKKENESLRAELDEVLRRHRGEIQRILRRYGVPELELISQEGAAN